MIRTKHSKGFTLIEILVALAIFAIIGIAAATCLHQMIEYRTKLTKQTDTWRQMAIARLLLQKDFSNAVHINQKDFLSKGFPSFSGQAQTLTLTRWNIQQAIWNKQTSVFVTISYVLVGQNLIRISINPLGAQTKNVLLQHVKQIHFYYLNPLQQWSDQWNAMPTNMVSNATLLPSLIPVAMRLDLYIQGVGKVQWDFVKPVVSG